MSRILLKDKTGVTLVELLIALVISAILTSAVYRTFIVQQKSYAVQEDVSDMQQNARVAVNRMLREIRMAGFGGRNENSFGESDILKTFGNVNGYTRVVFPENDVATDGITHDRITVLAAYHLLGKLEANANKGADGISVTYNSGVKFNSDKKKYVCINGVFNYEIEPTENKDIKLAGGKNLTEDHLAGEPVFLVEALTYGLRMDDTTNPPMPVLFRNENTGGGRVTMAENIEGLQFRYRVRKKSDQSDGGEVDAPDLINYVIVGVRATLVARTRMADPQLKDGSGFRRRTVETYIDVRNMRE
jgi:prepilin-type N-terminal cleavage/methylation domain-containing protein